MKSPAQTWSCRQKLHPSLTSSLEYWLVCCASIARSNATGIHHVPTASRCAIHFSLTRPASFKVSFTCCFIIRSILQSPGLSSHPPRACLGRKERREWILPALCPPFDSETSLHCLRPMSPALPVRQRQLANAAARIKISRNALLDVRNCSSSMPMAPCRYLVLLFLPLLLPLSVRYHHFRQPPPTQSHQHPRHPSLHRPALTRLCRGNQVLS